MAIKDLYFDGDLIATDDLLGVTSYVEYIKNALGIAFSHDRTESFPAGSSFFEILGSADPNDLDSVLDSLNSDLNTALSNYDPQLDGVLTITQIKRNGRSLELQAKINGQVPEGEPQQFSIEVDIPTRRTVFKIIS